jgi:hypothetical protein
MNIPGSNRLLRHASRQLGGRVVRELGISNSLGTALGLTDAEDADDAGDQRDEKAGAARQRPLARPPLRAIDKATERAIGERAFQVSLAYLDSSGLSPKAQSSLAQAIAHAVVEALDEYVHRAGTQDAVRSSAPAPPTAAAEEQVERPS